MLASCSGASFQQIQTTTIHMKSIIYPIVFTAITSFANARDVRLEDCPQGVRETIATKLDGGRIDDIESRIRNGKTRYVVEIDGPGRRDLTIHLNPSGRVISESEDFTLSQCPAKVRNAIVKLLTGNSGWSLDDIDRVTNSKGMRFQIDVDRRGQRDLEIVISSNGKVIKRNLERLDP